jgi:hypothetical protein
MAQTLTVAAAYDFLDQALAIADVDTAAAVPTSTDIQFANTGNEVLLISNGATPSQVTVNAVADPYGRGGSSAGGGGDDNNVVVTLGASKFTVITFANPAMFNSGGNISLTFTNVTTVKVLLIRLRKNR